MLVDSFISFLSGHVPEYKSGKYLLAVSGGMDSMIMLHFFKSQNLQFAVAHCNFNLRGDDSKMDEAFVEHRCKEWNIQYYIKQFDTLKEKEIQNEGTQLVARTLRYAWFEELRLELGFDYICTAHHRRDNAETLIYRFINGAFPESLQGIKPVHGKLIRPMLYMDYEKLFVYSEQNNIAYRHDISNDTLAYARNKIRKIVLPNLAKVFGDNVEKKLETIAHNYTSYFALIKQQAGNLLHQKSKWQEINIESLIHIHGNNALLYEALKNYGFNWVQCENICSDLYREQGTVFENNERTYRLYFAHDVLQLVQALEIGTPERIIMNVSESKDISLPLSILTLQITSREYLKEFHPEALYLDYDLLKDKNLSLRPWEVGDAFIPFGMTGKKSVADFLKDLKMSPAEKQYQQVLCADDMVVGVIGKRIHEHYKITGSTTSVLVLKEIV
jgi:tRNA(Ile)-lysidine synthase